MLLFFSLLNILAAVVVYLAINILPYTRSFIKICIYLYVLFLLFDLRLYSSKLEEFKRISYNGRRSLWIFYYRNKNNYRLKELIYDIRNSRFISLKNYRKLTIGMLSFIISCAFMGIYTLLLMFLTYLNCIKILAYIKTCSWFCIDSRITTKQGSPEVTAWGLIYYILVRIPEAIAFGLIYIRLLKIYPNPSALKQAFERTLSSRLTGLSSGIIYSSYTNADWMLDFIYNPIWARKKKNSRILLRQFGESFNNLILLKYSNIVLIFSNSAIIIKDCRIELNPNKGVEELFAICYKLINSNKYLQTINLKHNIVNVGYKDHRAIGFPVEDGKITPQTILTFNPHFKVGLMKYDAIMLMYRNAFKYPKGHSLSEKDIRYIYGEKQYYTSTHVVSEAVVENKVDLLDIALMQKLRDKAFIETVLKNGLYKKYKKDLNKLDNGGKEIYNENRNSKVENYNDLKVKFVTEKERLEESKKKYEPKRMIIQTKDPRDGKVMEIEEFRERGAEYELTTSEMDFKELIEESGDFICNFIETTEEGNPANVEKVLDAIVSAKIETFAEIQLDFGKNIEIFKESISKILKD